MIGIINTNFGNINAIKNIYFDEGIDCKSVSNIHGQYFWWASILPICCFFVFINLEDTAMHHVVVTDTKTNSVTWEYSGMRTNITTQEQI